MATFNEVLEGGLNNSLVKRLAMAGGSPSPGLSPEMFPTINLGVAWEELSFNQGWRRWMGFQHQAAIAAQAARWRFSNPQNSNVLVVLERIILVAPGIAAATGIEVGMDSGYVTSAALATANALADFRDSRQNPSGSGVAISSVDTDAAILTPIAGRFMLGGVQNFEVPGGPWLLWNGGTVMLGAQTVNTAVTFNYIWSERAMTRGELLG